jgi:hypothetical protein
MNRTLALIAAALLAASSPAFGEDAHHPENADNPPATAPAKPAVPGTGGMGHMQENMKRMHEQMAQIRAASDAKERERLMDEHMKTMHESMSMMKGMMNCGRM